MFGVSDDQIHSTRELTVAQINATIPRKVRLTADGYESLHIILIVLGIGAILCGGTFYYYFFHQARQREALHRDGREAMGTITKIYSPGRHSGTLVAYTFRVDGLDYHDSIQLDDEPQAPDGPYLEVGEPIRIQYLPSNPWVNHPSGWAWWNWWDNGFPQLFLLLFPGMGVVGAVNLYRERHLARVGWVTEGKVIACAPKGSRFRVDYVFSSEDHEEFDGDTEDSFDEYQTDSKIRVIYLRKNPKRNDAYPLSVFETVE